MKLEAGEVQVGGRTEGKVAGEVLPLPSFLSFFLWVAIQLEFLGRLTDRLNRRPTGFYTGNAPKYVPK